MKSTHKLCYPPWGQAQIESPGCQSKGLHLTDWLETAEAQNVTAEGAVSGWEPWRSLEPPARIRGGGHLSGFTSFRRRAGWAVDAVRKNLARGRVGPEMSKGTGFTTGWTGM